MGYRPAVPHVDRDADQALVGDELALPVLAGVQTVTVRATTEDTGTEVRIIDRGRGFDPTQPRAGFRLTDSIEGRLREETVSSRLPICREVYPMIAWLGQ